MPRPCVCLPLADTTVIALAETGVSLSIFHGDVAHRVIHSQGQTNESERTKVMSEQSDSYEDALIDASSLTPVLTHHQKKFEETGRMIHSQGHPFSLAKCSGSMALVTLSGERTNERMSEQSDSYEVALIDAGFLTPVLTHHQKKFEEPGRIETEPGVLIAQCPYRTALAKHERIDQKIDKATRATAASRYYNRQRLLNKANAGKLDVGDRVMVKGQRITPLTAKWDHHFVVTEVRGKVITVLHVPTGKTQRWNRNKVRLVDPEVSWEGMRVRPRAQQITCPTASTFAGAARRETRRRTPLLPQADETVPIPAEAVRGRKRSAPEPQHPLLIEKKKRGGWDDQQMDILCFCAHYFGQ